MACPYFKGATYISCVVHMPSKPKRKELYVSFSRVTKLSGLYIDGAFLPPKPAPSYDKVETEYARLRTESQLILGQDLQSKNNSTKLIYQNIQSLLRNRNAIISSNDYMDSDVLLFVEPRISSQDSLLFPSFEVIKRVDVTNSRHESFGLVTLAKNAACFVEQGYWEDQVDIRIHTEISAVGNGRLTIVLLYKSPLYPVQNFLAIMKQALVKLIDRQIIIFGDFNIREDMQRQSLFALFSDFHLRMCLQSSVTTEAHTMIDYCFTNIDYVEANILESKTNSYHFPIIAMVPGYFGSIQSGKALSLASDLFVRRCMTFLHIARPNHRGHTRYHTLELEATIQIGQQFECEEHAGSF